MYGKRFNRNTSSDNCGLRKIEVSQNTDALFDNTTERAKQGRQSGTHRRGRLQRVTAEGQEERFPPPRLSARCRFSQETFAGTHGNGRDAPKAVLPANSADPSGTGVSMLGTIAQFEIDDERRAVPRAWFARRRQSISSV
jgi:hypothetical protein